MPMTEPVEPLPACFAPPEPCVGGAPCPGPAEGWGLPQAVPQALVQQLDAVLWRRRCEHWATRRDTGPGADEAGGRHSDREAPGDARSSARADGARDAAVAGALPVTVRAAPRQTAGGTASHASERPHGTDGSGGGGGAPICASPPVGSLSCGGRVSAPEAAQNPQPPPDPRCTPESAHRSGPPAPGPRHVPSAPAFLNGLLPSGHRLLFLATTGPPHDPFGAASPALRPALLGVYEAPVREVLALRPREHTVKGRVPVPPGGPWGGGAPAATDTATEAAGAAAPRPPGASRAPDGGSVPASASALVAVPSPAGHTVCTTDLSIAQGLGLGVSAQGCAGGPSHSPGTVPYALYELSAFLQYLRKGNPRCLGCLLPGAATPLHTTEQWGQLRALAEDLCVAGKVIRCGGQRGMGLPLTSGRETGSR